MKPLLLITAVLMMLSCSPPTKTDVKGLGGLKIDTEFESVAFRDQFRTIMDNTYFLERHTLGDGIGTVSDINIDTHNGKIIKVKFRSTPETNMKKIMALFEGKEKISAESFPEIGETQIFTTRDEQIVFMLVTNKTPLRPGQAQYEIEYKNRLAATQDHEVAMKHAGSRF